MQLGTQGILQHLRKVYIPLQRSGIKPSGEGDGAVDAALELKDELWGGKWDWIDFGCTVAGVVVGRLIRWAVWQ